MPSDTVPSPVSTGPAPHASVKFGNDTTVATTPPSATFGPDLTEAERGRLESEPTVSVEELMVMLKKTVSLKGR